MNVAKAVMKVLPVTKYPDISHFSFSFEMSQLHINSHEPQKCIYLFFMAFTALIIITFVITITILKVTLALLGSQTLVKESIIIMQPFSCLPAVVEVNITNAVKVTLDSLGGMPELLRIPQCLCSLASSRQL